MSDKVVQAHSSGTRICPAAMAWFRAEWAAVLFVVCLVTVLHHSVLGPVSKLSLLIVSNLAAPARAPEPENPEVIVVAIDKVDFEYRYSERTPLNRCKLAEDLETVVHKLAPRVLAVDFDLAPLLDESQDERSCQARIDELLRSEAKCSGSNIIPINLFEGKSDSERGRAEWAASAWMEDLGGIQFADPRFDLHLNVAMESRCDNKRLAERVCAALDSDLKICACNEDSPRPINYRAFLQKTRSMDMLMLRAQADKRVPCQSRKKVVFFGGKYGSDDRHLTPIGKEYGVAVHAARFVSLRHPVRPNNLLNFVLDLAFAFGFAAVVGKFLNRYRERAAAPAPISRHRTTAVLIAFVFCYVVLLFACLVAAQWLFTRGIIIEPLLIGVGLAIDGFIVAPWHHLGAHGHDAPPSSGNCVTDIRHALAEWRRATVIWWQSGWKEDWVADRVATVSYVVRRLVFHAVVIVALLYALEWMH